MASSRSSKRTLSMKLGTCVIRFDEPKVMGIVNTTPNSFSGDGLDGDIETAVARGLAMFTNGAAIVDVGGESTRPGAEPVDADLEISRTVPVIERLSKAYPGRVSIDSMKPAVAESAIYAGASIVNDVSGLRDPAMLDVVAAHEVAVIIMHMLGEPRTMQDKPTYKDVVEDILEYLSEHVSAAEEKGVSPKKIMVDPGIGFGKTVEHNLEILARLREFRSLGKPVVVGVSRKSFLGKLTGTPVDQRMVESVAAALLAVREGADIVRAHDVPETVRALKIASAVASRSTRRRR
jgi:dihydropteroate synthase